MAEGHRESEKVKKLRSLLRKKMKIEMTDGRVLEGDFVCTDSQQNVILSECHEYPKPTGAQQEDEEPRILGLAMVPGHHIVSIKVEASNLKDLDPLLSEANHSSNNNEQSEVKTSDEISASSSSS